MKNIDEVIMPNKKGKEITLSVRVHIKHEDIADLLDSASRGSSYWCENSLGYESETKKALSGTGYSKIRDYEDDPEKDYQLDLKMIKKGLTVMAKKEPRHFADFMQENADQITGDVFLQCCLFGEVRYS